MQNQGVMNEETNKNVFAFFDACETGKGWEVCKQYCTPDATFSSQNDPLKDMKSLEVYVDWMKGLCTGIMKGCTYDLKSWTTNSSQAVAYAIFHGTHNGESGPCPTTNKSTVSDYVYVMDVKDGKVSNLVKVWNSPWAFRELGWC